MKKNGFFVGMCLVLGLWATGCAGGRHAVLPCDVAYVVLSVDGRATQRDARPDITFASDGRVFGWTGCNRYFGQYVSQGSDVEVVGSLGMTHMYCHNRAEQEQVFVRGIQQVGTFEVKGRRLILTTDQGVKIEGVRAK